MTLSSTTSTWDMSPSQQTVYSIQSKLSMPFLSGAQHESWDRPCGVSMERDHVQTYLMLLVYWLENGQDRNGQYRMDRKGWWWYICVLCLLGKIRLFPRYWNRGHYQGPSTLTGMSYMCAIGRMNCKAIQWRKWRDAGRMRAGMEGSDHCSRWGTVGNWIIYLSKF